MKRHFVRYAHLTTLIADANEGGLHVFRPTVTYDKAIIDVHVLSAALVHLALSTASVMLSDG